jgi:hypothetical protein
MYFQPLVFEVYLKRFIQEEDLEIYIKKEEDLEIKSRKKKRKGICSSEGLMTFY